MHECIKFRRQWISPRRTRQPRRPDARRGPPGARHPEGITPHAASPWKSPPDGTPPPTAPLTFSRFLAAQGEDRLVGFMRSRTTFDPIPEVFAAPLAAKFRHYLTVGGCPEPAAAWCVDRNLTAALEAQKRVLDRWTLEAALHADARDIPKIRRILASLPRQLAHGGAFRWSLVEPRTNARKYGRALGWLIDAGMVRKVNRLDFTRGVGLPISLHENPSACRIFPADVGILCALADIRYVPSLTTVTNPTTPATPANPSGPDALPPGMLDALVRTAPHAAVRAALVLVRREAPGGGRVRRGARRRRRPDRRLDGGGGVRKVSPRPPPVRDPPALRPQRLPGARGGRGLGPRRDPPPRPALDEELEPRERPPLHPALDGGRNPQAGRARAHEGRLSGTSFSLLPQPRHPLLALRVGRLPLKNKPGGRPDRPGSNSKMRGERV